MGDTSAIIGFKNIYNNSKIQSLTTVCLNETYSRALTEHLSDAFLMQI